MLPAHLQRDKLMLRYLVKNYGKLNLQSVSNGGFYREIR